MLWTCKDGREIGVMMMSDNHIKNTLAMFKREGFIKTETVQFYLTCKQPNGDMAQDCFNMECDRIFDAPATPWIQIFIDELSRRGIMNYEY